VEPQVGDLVQLLRADPHDGNAPYGQVVGFLPVGGVLVVQAGAGAGVFAPQDLAPVTATDVPAAALADIRRRAGAADEGGR
jgi:hypothetical protein